MSAVEPRAAREFKVHYSTGQSAKSGEAPRNSFRLTGEGKLTVDAVALTFEGKRSGFALGGPPQIARADVVNVDYNPDTHAFFIRTRDSKHYVIVWLETREEAEALWALLPQQKTAEFLAEQEHHERFSQTMSALGTRTHVTFAIIAINVAVFIAMAFAGADIMQPDPAVLVRFGSNYGPLSWTGQEWRLLTSAFLHFGLIHIALNMNALYQAGVLVERLFGSARFALIYLLSALAGSVASGWWEPVRNSAGASGAIFGVYGALLAFLAVRRVDIPPTMLKRIGFSALLFCGYSLAFGAAHPLIDNACHVGGLLGGLISGALLARPFTVEARANPEPVKLVIAALVVTLPLALMAQPLVSPVSPRSAGLRFERDLDAFGPIEVEIVSKEKQILTIVPNVRVNRLEIAKRLRDEVLIPWRAASKPLLESTAVQPPDSHTARMQAGIRDYLRAREEALELRARTLESADLSDEARALTAEHRLQATLDALNALN